MKEARLRAIYARNFRKDGNYRAARVQSRWVSFWLRRENAGWGEERIS